MSHRSATILAWFLWLVGAALILGAALLSLANHGDIDAEGVIVALSQSAAFVAFGAVGLLVSTRRSNNAIGWLYLGVWIGSTGLAWIASFSVWSTVTDPGATGGAFAVWVNNWLWVPTIGTLLTFPLLLFPNGHLPTRRWRPFAWGTGLVIVVWSLMFAFEGADYTNASGRHVSNPYTPAGIVGFFNVGKNVLAAMFVCAVVGAVGSLVGRFRRGSTLERAQIKWLILAGSISIVFLLLPGDHGNGTWIDAVGGLVWALLPICVGIAILRYRLYEIDRIISRTVSYALVIGAISAMYLTIVTSLSQALPESNALGRGGSDARCGDAVSTVTFSSGSDSRSEVQSGPL